MAKNITDIEDYLGFTDMMLNNVQTDFEQFAFDTEKDILRGDNVTNFGLLGDQVYIALIADLDGNNEPQTAPYINLVDGINYTANNNENTIYLGLRKLLTYFVYSEWIKDNWLTNIQTGTVKIIAENTAEAQLKYIHRKAHKRWNKGVDLYNGETYDYILFNQSDFTNWNFTPQSRYLTGGIN